MNKKIVYFLMLALSVSLFSACSDDDDDNKVDDYAQQIAATYGGNLTITMNETALPAVPKDVVVSRTALNVATVQVADLQIPTLDPTTGEATGSLPIGNISVENMAVTQSGNTIRIAETTKEIEVEISGVKINVPVTVSGTHADNKLNLTIGVKTPTGDVSAKFEGAKK